MNEHESDGMWKLYGKTDRCIAVQSTYKNLRTCLQDNVYIGVVEYKDYENEWIPEGDYLYQTICKRKEFEYENEIRAILFSPPYENNKIIFKNNDGSTGKLVPIEPGKLIERIVLSPSSSKSFIEEVKKATREHGYEFNICQSSLSRDPVY
jgi:hypothetical protein